MTNNDKLKYNKLIQTLDGISSGSNINNASKYRNFVEETLSFIFDENIILYNKEVKTKNGSKKKDIVYAISESSKAPFNFFIQKYRATTITVECKNSDKLTSENFSQLSGYLNNAVGLVGFIVSKKYQKSIPAQQQHALGDGKILIHISNTELRDWLKHRLQKGQFVKYAPIEELRRKLIEIEML